jgi:hypothetical protein
MFLNKIINIIIIPKIKTEYPAKDAPKDTSPVEKKLIKNVITLAIRNAL